MDIKDRNNDNDSSFKEVATKLTSNNDSNTSTTTKEEDQPEPKSKQAQKVNFSLKKKKKTLAKQSQPQIRFESNHEDDQPLSVAAAAQLEVEKRKEEGVKLVIPLVDERDKNEPLLSGLKRIVSSQRKVKAAGEQKDNKNGQNNDTDENVDVKDARTDEDARAEEALIQAANLKNENTRDEHSTNFSAKGSLVIPKQTSSTNTEKRIQERDQQKLDSGSVIEDDTVKYRRDLERRAEDLSVESSAYVSVPIAEFGAAMLRGMGWTGSDNSNNSKKKEDDVHVAPRPHRLGLGATPLPPSVKNGESKGTGGAGNSGKRHWARKAGSMADRAHQEKEEEEERKWKERMEERRKNDLQLTLQVGSIVRVRSRAEDGSDHGVGRDRAKLVKVGGVPGLNRVLIRYENDDADTSVKKGDLVLVEKTELEDKPFEERRDNSPTLEGRDSDYQDKVRSSGRENNDRHKRKDSTRDKSRDRSRSRGRSRSRSRSGSRSRDRKRRRRENRSNSRDRYERSRRRDRSQSKDRENIDRSGSRHHRSSRDRDYREDREQSKKRRREREYDDKDTSRRRHAKDHDERGDRKKRSGRDRGRRVDRDRRERSQKAEKHWLTTNIRVRVVSKKIAKGRQFKEKGVVLDVLKRGAMATIQMSNGEILEHVPEVYLETALPKVGGNAIILTGSNKYEKGKLLERNSEKGRGVIQLFEDMNVKTLSLDDIAEYCGALDDTLADY